MILTQDQADLLRASYRVMAEDATESAVLFYARLFEVAPHTRRLFRSDLGAQGQKLLNTLGVVVARIHEFETMRPMLVDLGSRHQGYGVLHADYDAVRDALLWLVEHRVPGCASTRAVWETVNDRLAQVMQSAVHDPPVNRVA
jgi:nitric oxide dioxygenase